MSVLLRCDPPLRQRRPSEDHEAECLSHQHGAATVDQKALPALVDKTIAGAALTCLRWNPRPPTSRSYAGERHRHPALAVLDGRVLRRERRADVAAVLEIMHGGSRAAL